ncbi:unnamed protein product, partial [Meganyctiphanes norvegica]
LKYTTSRDGNSKSSQLIDSYSGNTIPKSVMTTENKAFIRFTSDSYRVGVGFALTWNTISSGGHSGCGGHFKNDSGSIHYPVIGDPYPDKANCSWVIESSDGSIEIKFTMIDTGNNNDFVYI